MRRCKTCRHWKSEEVFDLSWLEQRFITVCDCPEVNGEARCTAGAYADDDSGLQSWVETGPEFGCVHHGEK